MTTKGKVEWIVFEFNPEAIKLVDELRIRTGASTRSELFRNMLKFAALSLEDLEEGYTPVLQDKNGNLRKSTAHKVLVWK